MFENLFIRLIKSEYVRSWILAQVRHVMTALGTALVMHGLADKGLSEQLTGFVLAAVSFYLANLDVRVVDGKIRLALETPPPGQQVLEETQPNTETSQPEGVKQISDSQDSNSSIQYTQKQKPFGDIP